jgi:hypothetical protein
MWVTWESTDNYLPSAFYSRRSPASLSAFTHWIDMDPITGDGNMLASYKQVELVILGFGLAFRAIWVAQFPERFSNVPTYVLKSSYPFSQYEQLSHSVDDLIAGYSDTYVPLPRTIISQYTDHLQRLEKLKVARRSLPQRLTGPTTKTSSKQVGEEEAADNNVVGDQDIVGRKSKGDTDGPSHERYVQVPTIENNTNSSHIP